MTEVSTKTVYVARFNNGRFAAEGRETGMGRAIVSTTDVLKATHSSNPAGLMLWMGGHYRATVAVPVTIVTQVTVGDAVAYPDEKDVYE